MCFDNLKELFHCADRCGLCTAIVACVPQKREHLASFSEGCLHLCNCGCCLLVALVVIALFFVYLFGIIAYFVGVSCVIFILILFAGWWLPWKLNPERKCIGHLGRGCSGFSVGGPLTNPHQHAMTVVGVLTRKQLELVTTKVNDPVYR